MLIFKTSKLKVYSAAQFSSGSILKYEFTVTSLLGCCQSMKYPCEAQKTFLMYLYGLIAWEAGFSYKEGGECGRERERERETHLL